jgi:signal transduction histidine kinase
MDISSIVSSVNLVIIIVFSLTVFLKDFKNKVNQSFLALGFVIALWIVTNLLSDISGNVSSALFWARSAIIGPAFLPLVFFYLISFLFNRKIFFKTVLVLYSIASSIILIFTFTSQNIEKVFLSSFGTEYTPGPIYYFLFLYFIIGFGYAFYILIKIYKNSVEPIHSQSRLILIGSFSTLFLGIFSNIVLPIFGLSIASIIGPPSVLFFIVFTALAILQYRLFDLKIVATELFTSAIWIALLYKLLSDYPSSIFFNGIILIFVIFFGILVIRSVSKEVKQREEIAKMAEDVRRAYELEKKAKEDINRAYDVERDAKEEIEKLDKVKDQFLMTTQHNLRTPLTSMMGYSDLILSGEYGKQTKKTTEVVKKFQMLTQSMIRMVNDFLDMAQFQLGKQVLTLKPGVDILPMLKEIMTELEFKASSKGVYLKLENPEKVPAIIADREKLKAALFNIIDNSVKYTPKGGVTVVVKNHDSIKISVTDTGIGIAPERLKNIFNTMFERGAEAKKIATTGSGVGLYLSYQIIKAHNGNVTVNSKGQGQGSVFYVELPIVLNPSNMPNAIVNPDPQTPPLVK